VTVGEDARRVRRGAGPQVPAAPRSAVVHVLVRVEAASRPAAIDRLRANPDEAKDRIGIHHRE
jgi:hypothetical protein